MPKLYGRGACPSSFVTTLACSLSLPCRASRSAAASDLSGHAAPMRLGILQPTRPRIDASRGACMGTCPLSAFGRWMPGWLCNCPSSCFWRQTGAFTNVAVWYLALARQATFQASSPSALSAQTDSSRSTDRHKIRAATLNGLQLKKSQESKEASATAQKKDAATAAVGQFLDAGSPG
ncbi:hypothetical protein IWZ01DRAFT_9252 [Phyllosticta capitalensis]